MIKEKLTKIQTELKAPKNQFNSFGKYKYRNLEDICEAVKPLLKQENVSLKISDEIIMLGDRYYVKATAILADNEKDDTLTVTAFARESLTKKGMDESQITGAASSYARKYCLNGLFLIDDTKDADTMDNRGKQQKKAPESDFKKKMKGWAQNESDIYWKVLGEFGFKTAGQVPRIQEDKILKKMSDSLQERKV